MSEKKELQICASDESTKGRALRDYRDALYESAKLGENCEINFYTDNFLDALKDRGFEVDWHLDRIVACYKKAYSNAKGCEA